MSNRQAVLEQLNRPLSCRDLVGLTNLNRVQVQNVLFQLKEMKKVTSAKQGKKWVYAKTDTTPNALWRWL